MDKASFEIKDGNAVVHVDGAALIETIAGIHTIFVEAYNSNLPIILDIENVHEADSTFIQLLRSLCYSLKNNRKTELELSNNRLPLVLKEIIKESGFVCRAECVRIDNVKCICDQFMNIAEFKLETSE
jgi:anti-anti-sigma regulatory factor